MVDLKDKIENNLESEKTYNYNLNTDDNSIFQEESSNNVLDRTIDNFSESITDKINNDNIKINEDNQLKGNTSSSEDPEVANCLALTVKKDYNLTIVKNVFIRTLKNTWRIALSIFTLNILKFFL